MSKIKLSMGKIDYINTSPVYYGLDNGLLPDWIEMIEGPPAVLNAMIQNKKLDISPVSATFYAMNHNDLLVLPDLSISCYGEVLSVILMTNHPLDELNGKVVVLTRDSATSSSLVQLIMSEKGIVPEFITKKLKTLDDVPKNADAAMIIGDAAMTQPWEKRFKYRVDLGDLWYQTTGLPFVFALWVVRKDQVDKDHLVVKDALELFYKSRAAGYDNIDEVIKNGVNKLSLEESYIKRYFDLLLCDLDHLKIKALKQFFDSLYTHKILKEKVDVKFFGL